ncbi:uncharacterized oxidoreductase TM_0325-like [Pieris napi]|uniref:uncharacterized oxidoreductase TM_0325-like n=1 Tax=Pieris napi TaxID=78633 RepID=UPI001FBB911E|nr:uncharacterized oxidoreductase TM_0325-like [Pieris napi]
MYFENKVVLITGASSGIGAEIALHFAKQSAKLALAGRNVQNLESVASLCEKEKGVRPIQIVADITKESDVERILKETIYHFARLDVLVNNAGMSLIGGIKDKSLDIYDKIMSVNLRAVYQLTYLAAPYLIATKGSIVNISSIASSHPFSDMTEYCMSKAALDMLTKCVAFDLAQHGVRVNAVNPGLVKTNLINILFPESDKAEQFTKDAMASTPLKRLTEAYDVATLVIFLASDKAKSITGCCYPVDGGKLLV